MSPQFWHHTGLISAWTDERADPLTELDIYAQRLDANGYWGVADPEMTSVEDFPSDQGGTIIATWSSAYVDADPYFAVEQYTLWLRAVGASAAPPLSPDFRAELRETCRLDEARLTDLLRNGWTYVVTVPATQAPDYSALAPTFGDSTASGIPWMEYEVLAHGTSPGTVWESAPMTGYSVDNWAPGAPLDLEGEMVGDVASLWWTPSGHHDEDLDHYIVYRGMESGFPLDEAHRVGTAAEPTYTEEPGPGIWHYRVTAIDVHGNESEGSDEVILSGSSSVEEQLPNAFFLSRPYPNPASGRTTASLALPEPREVEATVVDVRGARIAILAQGNLPAGVHALVWDGRDGTGRLAPSGVYLLRVQAGAWRGVRRIGWIR